MKCIHIITPVKDSIELTLQTVDAIMASDVKIPFTMISVRRRIRPGCGKHPGDWVSNW